MDALTNLRSSGTRTRIMDAQLVTKIPVAAKLLISRAAADRGVSDAAIVREALAEYFERRGYES